MISRNLENPTRAYEARRYECGAATGSSQRHRRRGTATFVLTLLWIVFSACVMAGCGQSAADKANNQVCSARADIDKQLHYLQGLTLTTATATGVQNSLKAISSDLSRIKDAQPQLNAQRKQQVQAANQAFTAQLQSVASSVGQNLSLGNAGAQLKAAVTQLVQSYQHTFAAINCG